MTTSSAPASASAPSGETRKPGEQYRCPLCGTATILLASMREMYPNGLRVAQHPANGVFGVPCLTSEWAQEAAEQYAAGRI